MTTTPTSPPQPKTSPARIEQGGRPVSEFAKKLATEPPANKRKRSFFERGEAFVSRLSTKNNFWHRVCSLIWLPYAFRSGITMKRIDEQTFKATLPFRRFNKNWYNAMAGAALLGNSEIAGGSYVFGVCGGDYTVVCKHLEYRFLRPCFGPAEYRITPTEDIHALVASGTEFNITVRMNVVQVLPAKKPRAKNRNVKPSPLKVGREKRVGRCTATFHVTPKTHHKDKKKRRANNEHTTERRGTAPPGAAGGHRSGVLD